MLWSIYTEIDTTFQQHHLIILLVIRLLLLLLGRLIRLLLFVILLHVIGLSLGILWLCLVSKATQPPKRGFIVMKVRLWSDRKSVV